MYRANFDPADLNPSLFSARRVPDRIHFRMVKCKRCGLVRSDPVITHASLEHLYAESDFTYGEEADDLRRTYGRYLRRLESLGVQKNLLLEIGCGNGFFLEEALAQGYRDVWGVEPSRAAIERAAPAVRDRIRSGLMRPGLFPEAGFDVVCLFQVFDHVADPGVLLDECFAVLKPGGMILAINHNVDAPLARLLGERCPIFDVEHTYLYSPATMTRMFTSHGLVPRQGGTVVNRYSLDYLCRLAPAPAGLKRLARSWLESSRIGRWRLWAPLGNLYLVAQKPEARGPA